ncbi:XRE family transcriptional regulator [Methylotenera sp. L2L1]|uniref:XRE family transcriptional regulator n=1 Tax=Methylotenera sp. L2L1 TaxID=1502770 RepID=UPI00056BAFB9|nr:XRE family transcriptional regulator [Methylotenera sp. L2L1]
MEKPLIAGLLIIIVFLIITPCFIWINNRFNNYEEFDELEESALVILRIKKQLLHELLNWVKDNNLNAKQIQERLMVSPKRAADIIYQRIDQFTVDSLTNFVLRTGKTVTVTIRDK